MAGKIPQALIDAVLARTDLVALVGSRVALRRAGHNFVACCPFHQEKTPSFSVSPDRQFYYCFGCQAHGNALTFLLQHDRLDFLTALRTLATDAGIDLPEAEQDEHGRQRQELLGLLREANRYYQRQLRQHPQRERAVHYLQGRGVSGAIAAEFELGYAPPGWSNLLDHLGAGRAEALQAAGLIVIQEPKRYDRLRDRVTFPIHDGHGTVVGFGGRVLGDETPKYLNSPETAVFHKGQELYGLYQARRGGARPERLIVVEGYLDVIALAQAGVAGAVATLGTALTPEHLRKLFQVTTRLIFCFDGDRAGYQAAWKALVQVSPLLDEARTAQFLLLPQGEDPDTLVRQVGAEEFERRLTGALPVPEFIIHHLTERHDPRQPESQRRLLGTVRPLFQQLPAGPLREVLLHHLNRLIGMDRAALLSALHAGDASEAAPVPAIPSRSAGLPSAVHLAIQCLLYHPELAVGTQWPAVCQGVAWDELALLHAVLMALAAEPQPTVAMLIAHWQGRAWGQTLAQLASGELPIAGTAQEWQDLLARIAAQCVQQRTRQLAAKGLAALTEAERRELQRLTQRESGAC